MVSGWYPKHEGTYALTRDPTRFRTRQPRNSVVFAILFHDVGKREGEFARVAIQDSFSLVPGFP